MDDIFSTAVSTNEAADASTFDGDGQWSERCAAMSVAYVRGMPNSGFEPIPDAIEILLPGDHAIFEVDFALPEGRRQTAIVRSPYVCVIPANRPHVIKSQKHPEMIVWAVNPAFYREKVQAALGIEPPEIALHHAVIDPFVREVGSAIRSEFHVLRLPATSTSRVSPA